MTIYYLYVKTHNITGLKYLGHTRKPDPYKYKGSGVYWNNHIDKHGYEVTTEILKECSSKEEIREAGIYYSLLWNVVNACDKNGNKIWANLVPETGDGGGGKAGVPRSEETKNKIRQNKPDQSGEKNGFYRKTHTEENKRKMGDANRGKDVKTEKGKESIRVSMIARWEDAVYREKQITALKNRKGEKRSENAKVSYKKSAKERNEKMTPEQRSARTKAGCDTKKIKYNGFTRKRYIDENGKIRYRWTSASLDKGKN